MGSEFGNNGKLVGIPENRGTAKQICERSQEKELGEVEGKATVRASMLLLWFHLTLKLSQFD